MANKYTVNKISKLGEHDEKFGTRYWAEVNEQLEPVMFNSQNQEIEAGATITAEEVLLKQSAKGTNYHQLRKVKVNQGQTELATKEETEHDQLDRIEAKLDKLLALSQDESSDHGTDTGQEQIPLDEIPF